MLLKLFSVGRLHIVAIGAFATLAFGWAFTGQRPWLAVALCALDWFLLNLLNRVTDVEEDLENGILAAPLVAAHRRAFTVGGLAVLALALAAAHPFAPAITKWRLLFHGLGFVYNWRLLPGGRRLKETYFWKNTASAVGFLITGFAYPLSLGAALLPDVGPATIAATIAFFVPFELSYEVIYDLRDLPGDRAAGVPTYAVVHGPAVAERIVWALIGASLLVAVGAWAAGVLPWRLAVMGFGPLTQVAWFGLARRRGVTGADCVGMTWLGAFLLATYQVWVALGLPGSELPR